MAAPPVWGGNMTTEDVVLTASAHELATDGTYCIISNTGANNIIVSPTDSSTGLLLAPGGTFETQTGSGSRIWVKGTAGQTVFALTYQ